MYAHVREDGVKQELEAHLLEVSKLAGDYASKISLQKLGEIAGLVHDVGKHSEIFQRYLLSATGIILQDSVDFVDFKKLKGKVDHSTAGAQLIHQMPEISKQVKELVETIVVSHHGGLINLVSPDGSRPLVKRLGKEIELDALLQNKEHAIVANLRKLLKDSEAEQQFSAHLELLKESKNDNVIRFMLGMTVKFLFSCLVDADRTNTIDFSTSHQQNKLSSIKFPWEEFNDAIETQVTRYRIVNEIDEFRKQISEDCFKSSTRPKGIYRLTVPTGGGKTISSLRFAVNHAKVHGLDRIIYIIPYTSIIDQNADVVRTLLKEHGLEEALLEHHSNLTDEENTSRNQIYSENWSAQVIYTTMVQFLETLFGGGTSSARRLHNLANSVIIFDEIQTIGIKHINMFNMALRYLSEICGSTILLCTATQPVLDHQEFEPYTLKIGNPAEIANPISELEKVFHRVDPVDMTVNVQWSTHDTARLAIKEHLKERSVLVIVNTKAAATAIAMHFEENGIDFYHLSTNMCPTHRLKIIREMKKRLETSPDFGESSVICVSTQLIEAGVDIDFNVVIRHLAGLDSMLQAAGRCNRNGRMKSKGTLYLVNPFDESLDKLVDIKKGKDVTLRVMRELKSKNSGVTILGNEAVKMFFEYYYYQRKDEMSYNVFLREFGVEETMVNLLSSNTKSVRASYRSRCSGGIIFPQAFGTAGKAFQAIDASSKGVIVPHEEGKDIINQLCSATSEHITLAMLKRAQQYSVNLYEYQIQMLFKEGGLHETYSGSGILYMEEAFYHKKYGVVMKGNSNTFLLC